jgi:hypothetical protein
MTPQRNENDLMDLLERSLLVETLMPVRVLRQGWVPMAFFASGVPLINGESDVFSQAAKVLGDTEFAYFPLPSTPAQCASVGSSVVTDFGCVELIEKAWVERGLPDHQSPSSASRYAFISTGGTWIIYAERSSGIGFFAVSESVDEVRRFVVQDLLVRSGQLITSVDELLSDSAMPYMIGVKYWDAWKTIFRESYG